MKTDDIKTVTRHTDRCLQVDVARVFAMEIEVLTAFGYVCSIEMVLMVEMGSAHRDNEFWKEKVWVVRDDKGEPFNPPFAPFSSAPETYDSFGAGDWLKSAYRLVAGREQHAMLVERGHARQNKYRVGDDVVVCCKDSALNGKTGRIVEIKHAMDEQGLNVTYMVEIDKTLTYRTQPVALAYKDLHPT